MKLQIQTPWWRLLSLALGIVLADGISKQWILRHFALGESRAVTSWFSLTYVHNTGTAFGLFQDSNKALLVIAVGILMFLLYSARGLCEQAGVWAQWGIGLVIGGAIGNMVDRIHYGHVIDFLDFHFWPVFNVADSAISVGALSLAVGLLVPKRS